MTHLTKKKYEIQRAAIVIIFFLSIVLFPLFIPNYQS